MNKVYLEQGKITSRCFKVHAFVTDVVAKNFPLKTKAIVQ